MQVQHSLSWLSANRYSRIVLSAAAAISLFAGARLGAFEGDRPATAGKLLTPATLEELKPDIEVYTQHAATLSDPFMEGRAPGTRGNRTAADYIEFHFRKLNLAPAFPTMEKDAEGNQIAKDERSSFRQEFVAPASMRPGDSYRLREQSLSVNVKGSAKDLQTGVDYNILGYSASKEATGQVVFVGYAVTDDDESYDSFPGEVDLTGKIAMVLRFEPMNAEGKSKWARQGWSPKSALEPKLREVVRRKAAGIILVNPPGADDERVKKLEGMGLSGRRSLDVPVAMMSVDAADAMVRAADGRSLMEFRTLADEKGEVIELPSATVTMKASIERVPNLTDNVGAILEGRGRLKDELVVVGAHYDHVGYGYLGSRPEFTGQLHPGADDNSSGTSALLLLARKLTDAYSKLSDDESRRSILFLAFSAEESGLNGSKHYVKNAIAPIEKHYLMLNMDMIGRVRDDKIELGGVASGNGLKDWLMPYVDASGFKIKVMDRGPSNSDHASFYAAKIPALFVFTGLHKEYHTPADVFKTLNLEGAARVADLMYRITFDAARRPEPMGFYNNEEPSRDTAVPTPAPAAQDAPAPGVGGVRFGIAPGDYSGDEPGVLVGEVFAGLPADKAGLKTGDVILRWNGKEIRDVESWMPMLSGHKAGDKVTIVYKREGKEYTTEATLVARARRAD